MTPKRILCPVDFSPTSQEALKLAIELARQFDGKLTLLHVGQPPTFILPDGGFILPDPQQLTAWSDQIERSLGEARDQALAVGIGEVETATVEGTAWEQIIRYARDHQHDLIVIGTHGRTGIQHVLIGSVAERVVRYAPCPVLTVRAR